MVREGIVNGIDSAKNFLLTWLSADFITGQVTRIVTATGSGIIMVVMGLLVSVYMMIEKDNASVAAKRIVYGVFSPKRANAVVEAGRKINMIFRQYFAGKLLQALIVMVMAYVFMLIGRVEYAILFAVIIGFTNMIPYVGPWIGGVPTILISMITDPWMGLRALICVLAIQAVDNWIVSPRIVGHKMGVSPLLVLAGLCIGGKLFGFVGMVFGDVLAAIVKVFFYDSFIALRLHKKVKAGELPAEYSLDKADLEEARRAAVPETEPAESPEESEEKKGPKAFFKKLFRKKEKKD